MALYGRQGELGMPHDSREYFGHIRPKTVLLASAAE